MPRILLILPVAAVLLAGMSAWKLTRPPAPRVVTPGKANVVRLAPKFSLYDSQGQLIRLEQRFIGRSKFLVVFFQAADSFDDSPALSRLRQEYSRLFDARVPILAIGTSQSAVYRRWIEEDGPVPFTVLSDVLDAREHLAWGAIHPKTDKPCEAVFVVDRAGWIRHGHVEPDLGTPEEWSRELDRVP